MGASTGNGGKDFKPALKRGSSAFESWLDMLALFLDQNDIGELGCLLDISPSGPSTVPLSCLSLLGWEPTPGLLDRV